MYWHEHLNATVDFYCERTSSAFWSEPVNALSNLAFVISGIAVWRALRADGPLPVSIGFMAPLMVLIGIGSFIFHTIATSWSLVLDAAPITLFTLWYFGSVLVWFYRLDGQRAIVGVAAFVVFIGLFIVIFDPLIPNHSAMYTPVLLLLIGVTVTIRGSKDATVAGYWPSFAAATVAFAVALIARTVDNSVCGSFPLGTHFGWHVLTGALLYLASRPLIDRWRSQSAAPAVTSLAPGRQRKGDVRKFRG